MTIQKILQKLQVTRAVSWSLLSQFSRLISGVLITFLYIKYLDLKSLGYAYTFASVLGISIFLEMGFSQNIVQFVCHEFAKLKFTDRGTLTGDKDALSRIISIGRLSFKYYSLASIVLFFLLLTLGTFFLKNDKYSVQVYNWEKAWYLASVVACLSLVVNPMLSIFEGCNRIGDTERLKCFATLVGLVLTFCGLHCGLGLYAVSFSSLASVCISLVYFLGYNSKFMKMFTSPAEGATVSWKKEIWPLQWRIAISWISGYFIFSSIVPTVFRIAGPENAGRVGFSLQVTRLIGSIATSWSATRIPEYGMCAAEKKWLKLDLLWWQSAKIAITLVVIGNAFLLCTMHFLSQHFVAVNERYVGMTSLLFFAMSGVAHTTINLISYYLRAFKKEPFALVSAFNGFLTILMTIILTIRYNVFGTALAYLICNLTFLLLVCIIFKKKKITYINETTNI